MKIEIKLKSGGKIELDMQDGEPVSSDWLRALLLQVTKPWSFFVDGGANEVEAER